jgi:hypothetical protein
LRKGRAVLILAIFFLPASKEIRMDMNQLTGIFCQVDDFCKELNQYTAGKLLPSPSGVARKRGPACCLDDSEIMTILKLFACLSFKAFQKT